MVEVLLHEEDREMDGEMDGDPEESWKKNLRIGFSTSVSSGVRRTCRSDRA